MSRYRKSFEVDASAEGKLVYLDFDGVYRAADFWLNGEWIGHHESGYAPFRWYIHNATGAKLNYGAGAKNVLAVHVDALHCERSSSLCGTLKARLTQGSCCAAVQEGWFCASPALALALASCFRSPVVVLRAQTRAVASTAT